ncbi:metalloendoproteinase 1-MMP-like [Panicum virgatum]|uniref:Peptidase metallopeptidase domain-containing protein n=1 Tax=Panicum virgatum TaxID=38727 RepID=A0A8T0UU93_PANVG|nr:metalloendoproteinase 1-MMP-like [Panicum virgatum]KAG2626320.1 hypothetical protein PVAP13_3KG347500 [Panicum virgatum]
MLPSRRAAACLLLVALLVSILSCRHGANAARPAPAAAAGLHRRPDGAAPLRSLKHLQGAGRGSRVAGLAELKRHLAWFGYLRPGAEHDDAFDDSMEAAVKQYQSRLGLPVTGRLDPATLGRITSPRCGVSDGGVPVVMSDTAASRFTFFDGEPRWTGPGPLLLTYSVSSAATAGYYLPPEAVRAAFRSAFAWWAKVIPVEFVEIDSYHEADIRVGFYEGDHGDGSPFDGEEGVVAHAYGPKDGRVHFNAAERWTLDADSETEAIDLESVAIHEIGHSSSPEAVMYPYINFGERKVELSVDDIEGVQLLYGSNPRFRHEQQDPSPSVSPGRSWLCSVSFVCAVLVMLVTHL